MQEGLATTTRLRFHRSAESALPCWGFVIHGNEQHAPAQTMLNIRLVPQRGHRNRLSSATESNCSDRVKQLTRNLQGELQCFVVDYNFITGCLGRQRSLVVGRPTASPCDRAAVWGISVSQESSATFVNGARPRSFTVRREDKRLGPLMAQVVVLAAVAAAAVVAA